MRNTLSKVYIALSQGLLQGKQLIPTVPKYLLFHVYPIIAVHKCFQMMSFDSEHQYPYMKTQPISSGKLRGLGFQ